MFTANTHETATRNWTSLRTPQDVEKRVRGALGAQGWSGASHRQCTRSDVRLEVAFTPTTVAEPRVTRTPSTPAPDCSDDAHWGRCTNSALRRSSTSSSRSRRFRLDGNLCAPRSS